MAQHFLYGSWDVELIFFEKEERREFIAWNLAFLFGNLLLKIFNTESISVIVQPA